MSIRLGSKKSDDRRTPRKKNIPLLVYGVKTTNRTIPVTIDQIPYKLAGYVSADPHDEGKFINRIPVFHDDGNMARIVDLTNAKALLIDPRCLDRTTRMRLADACRQKKIDLLYIPRIETWDDLPTEKPIVRGRKVQIEDLLGRTSIYTDIGAIEQNLNRKSLLVTGAAGSIGSEIARQLTHFQPSQIVICDVAETPLYHLLLELQEKNPACRIMPFLGDVRDKTQMELLFDQFHPDVVFHAAAYKHVTMMEQMPCQSVLTNIWGTMNMADLAVKYGIETFVMISSDKAVNPTNVMGTSKRIAEIYVQALSRKPDAIRHDASRLGSSGSGSERRTRFITTRFGNVLGSNGSVVPLFERQIEQGGPLTVTHPDVFRYFMTIPEACGLVIEATNMGKNGEVFVLDMGRPMKIRELAEKMIRLSGYEPYRDIDIVFTGLRPGEKLSEELLYDKETVEATANPKILIGRIQRYEYDQVFPQLERLIDLAARGDKEETVRQMKTIVPEFVSNNSHYEGLQPIEEPVAAAESGIAYESTVFGVELTYAQANS